MATSDVSLFFILPDVWARARVGTNRQNFNSLPSVLADTRYGWPHEYRGCLCWNTLLEGISEGCRVIKEASLSYGNLIVFATALVFLAINWHSSGEKIGIAMQQLNCR